MLLRIQKDLFHTHPWDEKKFGLDKTHVVVDRAAFIAVIHEIQDLREKVKGVQNGNSD